MELNEKINKKILEMYDSTGENVHGVSLGYKYKNNQRTEEISIVFKVKQKLPADQVPAGEMVPQEIEIDGVKIRTDVQQANKARLVTCFQPGDQDILRLQPVQSGMATLSPMRGGQEIIMFPKGWKGDPNDNYSIEVGTLGFFCIDDVDGKVVGITNSHVVVENYQFASERLNDGSNSYDPVKWVNGTSYNPGALSFDTDSFSLVVTKIKRYSGVSLSRTNYIDTAVLMMNPNFVDNNSHKIWGPIGVDPFSSPMPFATTQEINSLLTTNPRLFSTGRTTGPKGFANSPSCNLRVSELGASRLIGHPTIGNMDYADLIVYEYEDQSPNPCLGGDSGSALVALFGSTYKIIGQVFAGDGGSTGIACRIDRMAQEMKIRAWAAPLNFGTGSESNLGEMRIPPSDNRSSQTSFVHTDRYWQMGFRV